MSKFYYILVIIFGLIAIVFFVMGIITKDATYGYLGWVFLGLESICFLLQWIYLNKLK